MILAMLSMAGGVPVYGQQFDLSPAHTTDDISFTNPNPWTMTLTWQTPGSSFSKPSDTSVAPYATETMTAGHPASGGDASVETTGNTWSLPNGASGTFAMTYNYSTS